MKVFLTGKFNELRGIAEGLDPEKKRAFEKGILQDLKDPAKQVLILKAIVNYVPTDSKNTRWEAEGGAAYYNKAKKAGNAKSLTYAQRYKLMAKLINHPYSTHELWGVLVTAPPSDATALIIAFGWDRLNKLIGENGKFSKFSRRFPAEQYRIKR